MNNKLISYLSRIPIALIVNQLGKEVARACANYDIARSSKDLVKVLIDYKKQDIFKDQRLIHALISQLNPNELLELNNFYKKKEIKNITTFADEIKTSKWGKNQFSIALLNFLELDEKLFFSDKKIMHNEHEKVNPRLSSKETTFNGLPIFTPEMYPLHPYQKIIKDNISNKLIVGDSRFIVHMPTGSGKTKTCIEAIIDYWRIRGHNKGFIIWFTHSKELCEQSYNTFKNTWQAKGDYEINMFRCYESHSPSLEEYDSGIIFVGFQKFHSLLKNTGSLFIKLRNNVRLIVVDEAHISIAKTYQKSIESLSQASSTRLIGLTATPGRSTETENVQNRNLAQFYNSTKISMMDPDTELEITEEIKFLQDNEYLAKINKIEITEDIKLSEEEKNYILKNNKLSNNYKNNLSTNEIRNAKIIIEIRNAVARGDSTLVFATSIQHAIILKILLNQPNNDIHSECVFGDTNTYLRNKHINDFKTGILKVLINYSILTTGFDAPIIKTLIIARPTLSIVLYSQMLGRALRGPKMGGLSRTNTVVDLIDNYRKLGNVNSAFKHFNEFY